MPSLYKMRLLWLWYPVDPRLITPPILSIFLATGPAVSMAGYDGRAEDAPWRKAAEERIAQNRKSPIEVLVYGPSGRPLKGATVSVHALNQNFRYGTAVNQDFLGAGEKDLPLKNWDGGLFTPADAERYRNTVAQQFNLATPVSAFRPHVLPRLHTPDALRETEQILWKKRSRFHSSALTFLGENSLGIRAHYLITGALDHESLAPILTDAEALKAHWLQVARTHTAMAPRTVMRWDALIHPCAPSPNLAERLGGPQAYADLLKSVRENAPRDALLFVNEKEILSGGARRDAFEKVLRSLVKAGQAPDGIGFVGHFVDGSALPSMDECFETIDRFAQIVPNIAITGVTIDTGDDTKLQADFLRDFATIAFSHPAVSEFSLWGFWGGYHWKPNAALWTKEWSEKPAARVWADLVKEQWSASLSGTTDKKGMFVASIPRGECIVRVAHGKWLASYTVRADSDGTKLTLTKEERVPFKAKKKK